MTARDKRLLPGLGLIVLASAFAVSSCPPTGGAVGESRESAVVEYVALGDSRSAAPDRVVGAGADGCGRSATGYPVRVAAAIHPNSFVDVTCSGATSANLLTAAQQTTSADGVRYRMSPQVAALKPSTTLVTVSIGGNDLRWWELVSACFPPIDGIDAGCRFDRAARERVEHRLAELAELIESDLDAVVAKAPHATVVVVGHGGIYGPAGCGPTATFSAADAAWVAEVFAGIDRVLRGSAIAHDARFVDVRAAAAGHEACAPAENRWFEGNVSTGSTPVRHPTPVGSAAIAALVVDALR
ncbi:SGNH/GDSL hydrolase family protein [Nocardia bovistercoris]|uniref:SGNH/GDSL hydrolase family protein n=1 Tax=Nocardia bovistercoris TaxID=2785916 RepID=A0A931N6A8_9NOCA|nr:SGNH/GDSL hydrolase family protein [Nocardia bovistercoris]MBH0779498.1 SGNH/GDSL hydrolase family protein [Nocardia bovistercoris]